MDLTQITQTFIGLGIGVFVGIGMGYIFFPHIRDYFDEKGAQKRKIIEFLDARGKVSPREVAEYLNIPLSAAEQELHELERRGAVRRVKNIGNEAFYENTIDKNSCLLFCQYPICFIKIA